MGDVLGDGEKKEEAEDGGMGPQGVYDIASTSQKTERGMRFLLYRGRLLESTNWNSFFLSFSPLAG